MHHGFAFPRCIQSDGDVAADRYSPVKSTPVAEQKVDTPTTDAAIEDFEGGGKGETIFCPPLVVHDDTCVAVPWNVSPLWTRLSVPVSLQVACVTGPSGSTPRI